MVPAIVELELLVPLNEFIFPEPEAGRPMLVLLFVQLKVVPETLEEKGTDVVNCPLQTLWEFNVFEMLGVGLTVIVKFCDTPAHPFAVGITFMDPWIGEFDVFVAVYEEIDETPEAGRPILLFEFVQEKVDPDMVELKVIVLVFMLLQKVWLDMGLKLGKGFTVRRKGDVVHELVPSLTVQV